MIPMVSAVSELTLHFFCAFYLCANFVVFFIPFWLYFAYHGSLACRALLGLTVIDYMVPLKMGSSKSTSGCGGGGGAGGGGAKAHAADQSKSERRNEVLITKARDSMSAIP